MRYMSFVRTDMSQGDPPQALMDAMGKLIEESFKAGTLIDTGGLDVPSNAIRVRMSGGNIRVVDGPYSEAKEVIGGYAVMQFNTREEAIQASKDFLALHQEHWPEWEGECEVRQIFGPND